MLDKTALYLGVSVADLINLLTLSGSSSADGPTCSSANTCCLPSVRRRMGARSGICSPRPRSSLAGLGPDAVTLDAATLPIEAFLGGNVFTTREVAQRAS